MPRSSFNSPLLAAAFTLGACAAPPTGTRVELSHDEARTTEDITVTIVTESVSSRGDEPVQYLYAWYVDGALVTDLTEATLPAARTRKGQIWEVEVTPFDGVKRGSPARASVEIVNTQPEVVVTVTNNTPLSTESVQATVEFYDADADPVEVRYTWFKNGRRVPEQQGPDLLPDQTKRDEVWRIQAVGFDGETEGYVDYQDLLIQNGAPTVDSIEMLPDLPYTMDDIVANATASDPDGDPITLTYRWFVDGVERSAVTGNVYSNERTIRGSVLSVEITAMDDELTSEPVRSPDVTILNTVPGPAMVGLSSQAPNDDQDIVCLVLAEPEDADGDDFTYTFSWTRNGEAWTGPVGTTEFAGDTIEPAYTEIDDLWACTVVANDGLDDGPPASTSAALVVSWTGPREFTNCAQTGQTGPSQSQCDAAYTGTTLDGEVDVSGGKQTWVVPVTGVFEIEAYGARGMATSGTAGGSGAIISGEFELEAGDVITVAVGQEAGSGSSQGGGGGATWVFRGSTPLLIAGGGGGIGRYGVSWGYTPCAASTTEYAGHTGSWGSCGSLKTSGLRQGGSSSCYWGGGGGGIDGRGQDDTCGRIGGGEGWTGSLNGGAGSGGGHGGFGGGGSGGGDWGAGGGGGYSGGDGKSSDGVGGGGGSYNSGTNKTARTGNNGHGKVVIDLL
jgi:hypothetical protein